MIADKRPELAGRLSQQNMPAHVGIIMDGNGRWAKSRGLPRALGHKAGVERLRSAVRFASDVGIRVLSVFAFSTENWKRPADEINALMRLLIEYLRTEIEELCQNDVKITFIGDTDAMPRAVREAVAYAISRTRKNAGLVFNIALNYGGRAELVRAAKRVAIRAANGELNPEAIREADFAGELYTSELPDLDLLIRTSGEQRLSNFMLYQAAYAEFVFTDAHWPDFDDSRFAGALEEYQGRARRFGGL